MRFPRFPHAISPGDVRHWYEMFGAAWIAIGYQRLLRLVERLGYQDRTEAAILRREKSLAHYGMEIAGRIAAEKHPHAPPGSLGVGRRNEMLRGWMFVCEACGGHVLVTEHDVLSAPRRR